MRIMIAASLAVCVAAPGTAQLLGGRVSLPTRPSIPTPPSVPTPPSIPAVDSARQTVDEATSTARSVGGDTPQPATVDVRAGVSTRVSRGTRCRYEQDDRYYDPVFRDGSYYCEQRPNGAGASARAAVTVPR